MSEVIATMLNRPETADALLNAAACLLDIGGGGRIEALAVRLPPLATILPSEEVLTAAREAQIRADQENRAERLRHVVDQWASRQSRHGIRTDWLDIEGDPARVVTEYGRRADVLVIARPTEQENERTHRTLHAALFETGCKVLVVPDSHQRPLGQVVAIAWKDDERAGKAVRDSLAILNRAKDVHVLRAGGPATMPRVLQDHDIAAVLHGVPDGPAPVAARLLDAAHRVGADLLVMGAFAHGALRERIFGGVTRYMLAHADIPLLMRH